MGTEHYITTVLGDVHANLDEAVSLDTLAERSGYSPFHFHRQFVEHVGETPKQHVLRMRLERAAYLLAITDQRVASIAFTVGFESHETFTRAFRRHFGASPTAYRSSARLAQARRLALNAEFTGDGCVLSAVQVLTLPPQRFLCARNTGAYADVSMPPFGAGDKLWTSLVSSAVASHVAHNGTAWSICHDDPTVTPGPQQRLDACVAMEGALPTGGPHKLLVFTGGLYAGIEHTGPHGTISQALPPGGRYHSTIDRGHLRNGATGAMLSPSGCGCTHAPHRSLFPGRSPLTARNVKHVLPRAHTLAK